MIVFIHPAVQTAARDDNRKSGFLVDLLCIKQDATVHATGAVRIGPSSAEKRCTFRHAPCLPANLGAPLNKTMGTVSTDLGMHHDMRRCSTLRDLENHMSAAKSHACLNLQPIFARHPHQTSSRQRLRLDDHGLVVRAFDSGQHV